MSIQRGATLRLFASLLLFALAIASLYLGLTQSPEIIHLTLWYVGALFFAVLGVIVLKWGPR